MCPHSLRTSTIASRQLPPCAFLSFIVTLYNYTNSCILGQSYHTTTPVKLFSSPLTDDCRNATLEHTASLFANWRMRMHTTRGRGVFDAQYRTEPLALFVEIHPTPYMRRSSWVVVSHHSHSTAGLVHLNLNGRWFLWPDILCGLGPFRRSGLDGLSLFLSCYMELAKQELLVHVPTVGCGPHAPFGHVPFRQLTPIGTCLSRRARLKADKLPSPASTSFAVGAIAANNWPQAGSVESPLRRLQGGCKDPF
ncbi:hypothetical protein BDW22DRAFT_1361677 [Trametopsis cervina]|nr:hypothetical protein BDW22DRAFT_1361677 [Trametopsis cervina]